MYYSKLTFFYSIILLFKINSFNDEYTENMTIRFLSEDRYGVNIKTKLKSTFSGDQKNFILFPKNLHYLLENFGLRNLNIKFTQGLWIPCNGEQFIPSTEGLELKAEFEKNDKKYIENNFENLIETLSGNFCASFTAIKSKNKDFEPIFMKNSDTIIKKGFLENEPVCIENIQSYIKLLPCKLNAGYHSLIDFSKLFKSEFVSISLNLKKICENESKNNCFESFETNLSFVSTKSIKIKELSSYSVEELFEKNFFKCVVESNSNLKFEKDDGVNVDFDNKKLKLNKLNYINGIEFKEKFNWNDENYEFEDNLIIKAEDNVIPSICTGNKPDFVMHISTKRYFNSNLSLIFQNNYDQNRVHFSITFPWFMKIYLHTIEAKLDNKIIKLSGSEIEINSGESFEKFEYKIASDRKKPYLLEIVTKIPKGSKFKLTFDFYKRMLHSDDYPPDIYRGFDISPAVATLLNNNDSVDKKNKNSKIIYSQQELLFLVTPDKTMPFKTILFSSLVISIFFASTFYLFVYGPNEFINRKPLIIKIFIYVKQLIMKKIN